MPTKEMSTPRVDKSTGIKIASSLLSPKMDTFDTCKRLVADVLSSLDVYSNRSTVDSDECKYIDRLRESINSDDPIATRFNNLHEVLSDTNCQTLLKKMGTLRSELISHMKKYQATRQKPFLKVIEKPASLTDKDKLVSGKVASNPALIGPR